MEWKVEVLQRYEVPQDAKNHLSSPMVTVSVEADHAQGAVDMVVEYAKMAGYADVSIGDVICEDCLEFSFTESAIVELVQDKVIEILMEKRYCATVEQARSIVKGRMETVFENFLSNFKVVCNETINSGLEGDERVVDYSFELGGKDRRFRATKKAEGVEFRELIDSEKS